jgi:hypothetical protein
MLILDGVYDDTLPGQKRIGPGSAASPPGFRPLGYWIYPSGRGFAAQGDQGLAALRDDRERAYVHRRLSEIEQGRRAWREALRVA